MHKLEPEVNAKVQLLSKFIKCGATQEDKNGETIWLPAAVIFNDQVNLAQYYATGLTIFKEIESNLQRTEFHNKDVILEKVYVAWGCFDNLCGVTRPHPGKPPTNDEASTVDNFSYQLDRLLEKLFSIQNTTFAE
jgi:hypothetical protein